MTVCYLEVDDEITGAIGRMRSVTDGEAVLVVPPGSRIATSRINFKLLAREAGERRLNVVAVSDEPAVRALAISAGLPAYDSLAAAEQALANFRAQDSHLAERLGGPVATESVRRPAQGRAARSAETLNLPWPLVEAPPVAGRPSSEAEVADATVRAGATTGRSTGALTPDVGAPVAGAPAVGAGPATTSRGDWLKRAGRRIGLAPVLLTVLLAFVVAGVVYGAYLFLPTATITLVPVTTALSLGSFTVTADPAVAVSDVEAGVIPAELIDVPVRVSGDFVATGIEARETRASGSARFRSENTLNDVPIPEGTQVSTADDIDFVTTEPATAERASFESGPTTVDVAVRAVRPGPRGNVAAGAITRVPNGLEAQLISVSNQDPTTGGRRIEESIVTAADYDLAVAALLVQLDAALAGALADPATTPRGLTLFPETARLGESMIDPVAADIAGTPAESFSLAIDNVVTVVAVNENLVDEVAAARLRSTVAPPQVIVADQVNAGRSPGTVVGQTIVYQTAPTATAYALPERAILLEQVRGKTIVDAEQILSAYGMVDIEMWPEFVDRLPDQAARIGLTIQPPGEAP